MRPARDRVSAPVRVRREREREREEVAALVSRSKGMKLGLQAAPTPPHANMWPSCRLNSGSLNNRHSGFLGQSRREALVHPSSSWFEIDAPSMLRRALLFAPSAFAFGLGTWQVQRLEEKRTEIEYRESLLGGPPLDLNSSSRSDLQRHDPVACRGRFLHDRSVYVGPRVRSELGQAFQGCMVVTPLVLDDDDSGRGGKRGGSEGGGSALSRLFSSRGTAGSEGGKGAATADGGREGGGIVLVLRGWVPQMWRSDPSRFDAMRPRESVEVQGLVKHSDEPGYFAPDNLPEIGQWFYYDIPAMVSRYGAFRLAPDLRDLSR